MGFPFCAETKASTDLTTPAFFKMLAISLPRAPSGISTSTDPVPLPS